MLLRLLLLLLFFWFVDALPWTKTVTVIGRLKCDCKGEKSVECQKRPLVQLWEDDDGLFDDKLNGARVPFNGAFNMTGSELEFGDIEPYLLITHYCPDGAERKLRIDLDPVSSEKKFELGTIQLQDKGVEGK